MQLIENATVFDGYHETLKEKANIVIADGLVREITHQPVATENFSEVIDASDRVVIPGLVDAHVHLAFTSLRDNTKRPDELLVRSTRFAREMLLRGFTTVRDAGGAIYGLKAGIDTGFAEGPRIFPSYRGISQTGGHGDSRSNRALPRTGLEDQLSPFLRDNPYVTADGIPEVLRATREQLFLGASQIKVFVGGGLSSRFDPMWSVQYTQDELRAVVETTGHFGTYVMAHVYTSEGMQHAAKAGIRCFEHATLLDEETARIVQDQGIWLCGGPQFGAPFEDVPAGLEKIAKHYERLHQGEIIQSELINKYDIPVLFGTDAMRDENNNIAVKQLADLAGFKRRFGSLKGLRSATGNFFRINQELNQMCNPYPDGKVGVLEGGSFADLLIVEGNPVQDLDVLTDVDNIKVVMKEGTVYKNTL